MKHEMKKMMIKYVIILCPLVLAFFIKTVMVFAAGVVNTPHDSNIIYPANENVGSCNPCHEPKKDGFVPMPNRGYGQEGFVGSWCFWCHSGNAYGTSVFIEASFSEKYVYPGIGMSRLSHGLTVTKKYEEGTVSSDLYYVNEDPVDYDSNINTIQCTTCHNVHDNATNKPFLRDNIKNLCIRCHTKDDSHPAGIETEIFKKGKDSYLTLRPVEGFDFSTFIFRLIPFYSPIGATDGMAPQDGGGRWNLGRHLATDEVEEKKLPGTGLEGSITCVTCHAVHGVQDDSDANNPITLPNKNLLSFP